ncbi:sigma-70 family RNA polymerase sigma factor [Roseomonas soli]|uniref:Sigma-70 family RNA polymerase sigma factor n=1 Tax=Neoroseomonas soli TaxID=1081025 RepID=A0A9X9X0H1_9PROT|nr:sigma-70 family RNA polymerase sigma factor [Neoroseomonas soli]
MDPAGLPIRSGEAAATEWEGLMAAAQQGDGLAYDRLLRAVMPFLRAIARRRFPNRADAEDAVQDTLMTLHALRHAYDPSRPLRPWLAALCERRCIDRMRWHHRHARGETALHDSVQAIAAPGMESAGERAILRQEIQARVAALPRAQRVALLLTKLEELPLVEASARSGMPVGALKIAVFRGIRSLRRQFLLTRAA